MRYVCIAMFLLLVTGSLACEGKGSLESDASSYLSVYDNASGVLIISGDTARGIVSMQVGDTMQLRVMRRVVDTDTGSTTNNVTQDADYNSTSPLVATVSQNGQPLPGIITAISVGVTEIEVVFRDEGDNFSEDDHAFLDVTVLP